MTDQAAAVADTIRRYRFLYRDEGQLQESLATVLAGAGHTVQREVILPRAGRIDFVVDDGIGIEVKVDGPAAAVARQLRRYASSPAINALILVTTRVRHTRVPAEINGKPIQVVTLVLGSFL